MEAKWRNPVARWFRNNGVETFFNCPMSPDLAPIKNAWQGPKQYAKKHPHWDEKHLIELLREGWEQVGYPYINQMVQSIPDRLQEVKRLKGNKTHY